MSSEHWREVHVALAGREHHTATPQTCAILVTGLGLTAAVSVVGLSNVVLVGHSKVNNIK